MLPTRALSHRPLSILRLFSSSSPLATPAATSPATPAAMALRTRTNHRHHLYSRYYRLLICAPLALSTFSVRRHLAVAVLLATVRAIAASRTRETQCRPGSLREFTSASRAELWPNMMLLTHLAPHRRLRLKSAVTRSMTTPTGSTSPTYRHRRNITQIVIALRSMLTCTMAMIG